MGFLQRLQHGWNAFRNETISSQSAWDYGTGYSVRPDRSVLHMGTERSIVSSIYNRIATDVAAVTFQHIRVDQNGRFSEVIDSSLNSCLNLEANVDQTGRALIQDLVLSLCDEGVVALVPTDTSINPEHSNSYQIEKLRVGQIVQWYPEHVQVKLYNEKTGQKQNITLRKDYVAIIENPFYSIMNEPNSTLRRLIATLNRIDLVDEQSASGKLDIIIQLPYVVKTDIRRQQAEERRKAIESQLLGSKYGIAYIDSTEHVTQLNRAAENNLQTRAEYLNSMLYTQLGITDEIMNGTADATTMQNYQNRIVEPFASAICLEIRRKFLTKTARSQGQTVAFFLDPFRLVPVSELANIADKFTRNEILSSNEIRSIIGYKPADDPRADELLNKNIARKEDNQKAPVQVKDDKVVEKPEV